MNKTRLPAPRPVPEEQPPLAPEPRDESRDGQTRRRSDSVRRSTRPAKPRRRKWLVLGGGVVVAGAAFVVYSLWPAGGNLPELPPDPLPLRLAVVLGGERRTIDLGGTTMTFCGIPAGKFMMGSPLGEAGRPPAQPPPREVTLTRPFWLARTEVTNQQWEAVMGATPSDFIGKGMPVVNVSWEDAVGFCRKLTERGKASGALPEGWEVALPTEAHWEYACRAGTTGPHAGSGNLEEMGWFAGNAGGKPHPVATKMANAWGLFDMHGNVWEWCADWFGDAGTDAEADPTGPGQGVKRSNRGGAWVSPASHCRSATRDEDQPGYRCNRLGFRPALVPSGK